VLERNDQLVRRIESEVLDRAHLGFAIFQRGQQTAVSHVLKMLGDSLREFGSAPMDRNWFTRRTMAGTTFEAAEHALRWILSTCPKGSHRPGFDLQKKDKEAAELLQWAVGYAQLYVDHTAWSRGMMIPLVDNAARTIVFDLPQGETELLFDQLDSDGVRSEAFEETIPPSVEARIVKPWIQSISGVEELPVLNISRKSAEYKDAKAWGVKMVLPEIAGDRDLGGFTLEEFRRFYVGLWLNCHAITRLEDMADRIIGQENPLGSRVVQGRAEYVAYWLSRACNLPTQVLRRILDLLTFDPADRHPSLAGHPFVPTVDGALTMMPRLFARTEPDVMLSAALNTGPTRRIYESIIGEIEVAAKYRLARLFKEHDYFVWDDPSLPRPHADPLSPDLIVGRKDEQWIVVIEYKHALPPRGSAAVSDRIKEASKWIEKAKRYLKAATSQVEEVRKRLGIMPNGQRVVVAIVPRWPMPIPISLGVEDVVLADLLRVERALHRDASISEVFGLARTNSGNQVRREFHEIRVADWTYKHPILVPDAHPDIAA
jgi:hypothetical protein